MRRALQLAIEQGLGRDAAVLHNNLAIVVWQYEGPQAALTACREGIDFCERRGITEFALAIAGMSATFLAQLGQTEQALNEAGPLAERLEAAGDIYFTEPRAMQLRLLTQRGAHEHAPATDELVTAARKTGDPQDYADTFSAATQLLLAQGQPQQALALLTELEQVPDTRADLYYSYVLPELVRTALALEQPDLANQLLDGVEPHTPLQERALCACRAQLTEAADDHGRAADLYREAAERWLQFGNVPERAYALLGRGRCLTALGQPADQPLREARDLFQSMGYKPALSQAEALLEQTPAAAS